VLIVGSLVQVVSLTVLGLAFQRGIGGVFLLFPILTFVAAFAAGMGPVPWVVISEIFPTRIRGQAMSLATLMLWAADFVVSQTFPVLVAHIGPARTFWIYAACSACGLAIVYTALPETRGRSLEEIDRSWKRGSAAGVAAKYLR
jgi:SP family arabinose:H+ symporter-like MFS transporter